MRGLLRETADVHAVVGLTLEAQHTEPEVLLGLLEVVHLRQSSEFREVEWAL